MKRNLMAAAAGIAIAAAAFTGTAQAQCAGTGFWLVVPAALRRGAAGVCGVFLQRLPVAGRRLWLFTAANQYSSAAHGTDPGGGFRHIGPLQYRPRGLTAGASG